MPPVIAAGLHLDRLIAAVIDDALLDGRRFFQRQVDVVLERNDFSPAPAAVRSDEERRLGVVVALGDGIGAEAAEDDAVRSADTRAGQHRDHQLGNHRHIERHPVAGLDAHLFQDVGEFTDLAKQVLVAEHTTLARLSLPDDRRLVAPAGGNMSVDAVVAGV